MATANIYKVYVDTTDDDVAVWTMEATSPASAIKKVLSRVSFGKSAKMENFEISAELEVRNMTYAEYKSRRTNAGATGFCQCDTDNNRNNLSV